MTSPHTRRGELAPDRDTVEHAIAIAARAPSLHNTQPWQWTFDGSRLFLNGDSDRLLYATDPHGRQWMISCGAVLHHARTALAALGWHTEVTRLPDRDRPDLLAVITFVPRPAPSRAVLDRASAIERRYSDRLPLTEPGRDGGLVSELRRLAAAHDVEFDILADDDRAVVVAAARQVAHARTFDPMYHDEIDWWAGHSNRDDGVPASALPAAAERARVGVARDFPVAPPSHRRPDTRDRAALAVLSTRDETPLHWLRTGEALSAILLECTARGLATCPLTQVTELPAARRMVARLLPHHSIPQVIIRMGAAPAGDRPPTTPRRAPRAVLTMVDEQSNHASETADDRPAGAGDHV